MNYWIGESASGLWDPEGVWMHEMHQPDLVGTDCFNTHAGVRPVIEVRKSGAGDLGELTGINFGNKTANTVQQGDTISIDDEQFMVLMKSSSTIMAIPYYNITLDTTNPVQSSLAENIAFSSSAYWETSYGDIDMTNEANNIQQYITAYSNKLAGLTNNRVRAEIGRCLGAWGLSQFQTIRVRR